MGTLRLKIKKCHSLRENVWLSNKIKKSFKKKWYFIKIVRQKQLQKDESFKKRRRYRYRAGRKGLFKRKRFPKKFFVVSPDTKIHKQKSAYIFGLKLKEKQKLIRHYGTISEKTFKNLCKNKSSQEFLSSLESRLDAILYKINFTFSPFAARQKINHGFFFINFQKTRVKGHQLKKGDLISTSPKKKSFSLISEGIKEKIKKEQDVKKGKNKKRYKKRNKKVTKVAFGTPPSYLEVNYSLLFCVFLSSPLLHQIFYPLPLKVKLIKEFYL